MEEILTKIGNPRISEQDTRAFLLYYLILHDRLTKTNTNQKERRYSICFHSQLKHTLYVRFYSFNYTKFYGYF